MKAGVLLIALAAACWGLLGPVSRLAFSEGVSPLEVSFWRAAIGCILFGIHALATRASLPKPRDVPAFILFGLIGGALFFASYQLAVQQAGASVASVLLYTAPVWVTIAGAVWLHERVTPVKIAAVVISLIGVLLIGFDTPPMAFALTGIVWGLVAGISYASYYVFGKLYFHWYPSSVAYALAFVVAALVLWPFVEFVPLTAPAIMSIVIIGTAATYLPYLIYAAGLKRMEASRAAIIAMTEPLVATALGHWWWGERLGMLGYAGGVLIFVGVAVSVLRRRSRPADGSKGAAKASIGADSMDGRSLVDPPNPVGNPRPL